MGLRKIEIPKELKWLWTKVTSSLLSISLIIVAGNGQQGGPRRVRRNFKKLPYKHYAAPYETARDILSNRDVDEEHQHRLKALPGLIRGFLLHGTDYFTAFKNPRQSEGTEVPNIVVSENLISPVAADEIQDEFRLDAAHIQVLRSRE